MLNIEEISSPLEPLFQRLRLRDRLSEAEHLALAGAMGGTLVVTEGDEVVEEGDVPSHSLLLVDGLAARYRVLPNGSRQISAFQVAGDFVDLPSFTLKVIDHSITAISTCRFITFPHKELAKIVEDYPHLTRLLWMTTLLDSAVQREWLIGVGRRSSIQRAAHLFCELGLRLDVVHKGQPEHFGFPATQADLADALGISLVHSNRVIQSLRVMGLLEWRRGEIVVPDVSALHRFADFDPTYLHLDHHPR